MVHQNDRAAPLRVGVLAVQGAVSEHIEALLRAAAATDTPAPATGRTATGHSMIEAVAVRSPQDLASVSGLVIPGGESTTISRLLRSTGLQTPITTRAKAGDLAVFGTCAGLILCSAAAQRDVADKDIELLGLLDAEVDRNAFGRQRDSFEADVAIDGLGTLPAVFIRAPLVTKVWGATQALGTIASTDRRPGGIVLARKGLVLGSAFHPELTGDTRLHALFLDLASQAAANSGQTRHVLGD